MREASAARLSGRDSSGGEGRVKAPAFWDAESRAGSRRSKTCTGGGPPWSKLEPCVKSFATVQVLYVCAMSRGGRRMATLAVSGRAWIDRYRSRYAIGTNVLAVPVLTVASAATRFGADLSTQGSGHQQRALKYIDLFCPPWSDPAAAAAGLDACIPQQPGSNWAQNKYSK